MLAGSAGAVPWLPGHQPVSAKSMAAHLALPQIARDGADEDTSEFYSYGFENDWSGWTHRDLTDAGLKWHVSERHAFSGMSWWAGDEALNGYDNHWLQYLESPTLDLRGRDNLNLKFMAYWSCEDPTDSPPNQDSADTRGYDGWDGCNVWISTNNGDSWQVIEPVRPAYDHESLFSFGYEWKMGRGIPGWTGSSGNAQWPAGEWVAAEFDLSAYNNVQQAKIRWAFCTDPAWKTGEAPDNNNQAWGFLVDSLRISAGNEVIWSNNGEEQGDMTLANGPGSGDFWEITDDDAHESNFSARCRIEPNLNNALISPPLDLQAGFSTWFEYWVRIDTRRPFNEDTTAVADYYMVSVSTDQATWTDILVDFSRPEGEWMDDFHLFGPDSASLWLNFNNTAAAWQRKLNLSRWAGQTVYLRWTLHTDTVQGQDPGTGLYIDDFRLLGYPRLMDDVKVEWVDVNYPNTMGTATVCSTSVTNLGINNQAQVVKWFKVDDLGRFPVQQWDGINSDSTKKYPVLLSAARLPYADSVSVAVYTSLPADSNKANDTMRASFVVYPPGIWKLGYDSRPSEIRPINFSVDNGPAVLFTPVADGVPGAYALQAIRVRWNNEQNVDVNTHMTIFADNRGEIGRVLYEADVTVRPEDCIPAEHVIPLGGIEALGRLQGSFWVYFNIEREDFWPQVMGTDEQHFMKHFHVSNGAGAELVDLEYQMHAIIMQAGNLATDMLLAGRSTLDFDTLYGDESSIRRVALFNGGINPVEVESAVSDNANFRVVGFTPTTLQIGDMMTVYVEFKPSADGVANGNLTFVSNDQTSPNVELHGVGIAVSVGEETPTPLAFSLGEAYPNPFNATTVIPFMVVTESDVQIAVYDLAGRLVEELVQGRITAGKHNVSFTGDNLGAGVYMLRMKAGSFEATQKLVLVK